MKFARTAVALAAVLVLALSTPALAQGGGTVPGWTSGILVSYNLADVEAADPLAGFAAELDLRFGGLPISFVGHVSSTAPQSFHGRRTPHHPRRRAAGGVRTLPVRVPQDGRRRN